MIVLLVLVERKLFVEALVALTALECLFVFVLPDVSYHRGLRGGGELITVGASIMILIAAARRCRRHAIVQVASRWHLLSTVIIGVGL